MLITVVSVGGRYGSDAPMFVVPAIASATPVPEPDDVGSIVIVENGGDAAHAWNSGVKSEDPFSVIVVDEEGGVSRVFNVFSSEVMEGGDDFAVTALVAAPDSGAKDRDSATALATAPVESAAMRTPRRRVAS
jgi:hypothetical protein